MMSRPTRYHGRPCARCTSTERWRANRNCVVCKRQRDHDYYWYRGGDIKQMLRRCAAHRLVIEEKLVKLYQEEDATFTVLRKIAGGEPMT